MVFTTNILNKIYSPLDFYITSNCAGNMKNPQFTPQQTSTIYMNDQNERVILKNGKINIHQPSISHSPLMNILNYHKLIDASWSYTLPVFFCIISCSLLTFGTFYWVICFAHGDFEPNHLPDMQKANNHTPCIYYMYNWASALQFSIETQYKVAYGTKATTDECPEAIFVNAVECLIGFIIQGFMTIIIFTKMTKPKLRSNTLLFSDKALITCKNDEFYLMFRIGDLRKSHIFNVNCRAIFLTTEKTTEGELIRNKQTLIKLETDGCRNSLFFNWPIIMMHKIDDTSPLFNFAKGLESNCFEILIVMEGVIQSTGLMTQATASFLPSDLVWGRQFQDMTTFLKENNEFEVDFSKFHCIEPVDNKDV